MSHNGGSVPTEATSNYALALAAQNELMRKALQAIANQPITVPAQHAAQAMQQIARETLVKMA